MVPEIGGVPTYYLSWALAALVAFLTRRHLNHRQARALPAEERIAWRPWLFVIVALLVPAGAKLLYLVEFGIFNAGRADSPFTRMAVGDGFRLPGGILLVGLIAPLLCKGAGLPPLRALDAALPTMGLVIFCVRIGCFLNGCCFGRISDLPWAVSFPRGSLAHLWHVSQGLTPLSAPHSLPVHPLQLYFALAGLLLFLFGQRWYRGWRFDGEVFLKFFLGFFGSTFVPDLYRVAVWVGDVGVGLAGAELAAAQDAAAGALDVRDRGVDVGGIDETKPEVVDATHHTRTRLIALEDDDVVRPGSLHLNRRGVAEVLAHPEDLLVEAQRTLRITHT
jgi:phosphatidylglycerol:prolipoprotein diacylglycerol transferase